MKKISFIILFFTFLTQVSLSAEPARIITSIFPVADIIRNIAGPIAEVKFIIKQGDDPHTFSLTPQIIRESGAADICVMVGDNFDGWLLDMVKSGGNSKMKVINLCKELKYEGQDPHIWLSPGQVLKIIKVLKNYLIEYFPDEKESILRNYLNYYRDIQNLDKHIRKDMASFSNKSFIASHSALFYFARDYGLVQSDIIIEHHGVEPSPKDLARIIDKVKATDIRVIINTGESDSSVTRKIAQETKSRLVN
ncbi:MAG: metal ABC transporter substrate-binding protein, partial [bacterium]|nr:metal ABC transporter substrate-binding protein [bacterium]